jgi:hypothetical protein
LAELAKWHRERNTSSLRVLATAIALVDAEPELAEMGPDGLPVAWRIFRPGWNTSRNGPVYFDELAAELVMQDYREHGARVQIDLDHTSLNKESKAYDPRGVGYHGLELREDGSLWACAGSWTERGAAMLRAEDGKAAELPYYSPAFDVDSDLQFGDEPDRVIYIFNGGLVGTPATDRPMALAAASRRKGRKSMNPKEALKALRAMSDENRGRVAAFMALSDAQQKLPSAKLAELLRWQDGGGGDIDPKLLQKIVGQIPGADTSVGIIGLMRQLVGFVDALKKAMSGEEPAPEPVPTEAETMADNPEDDKEREMLMAASRQQSADLQKLREQRAEDRKTLDQIRAERDAEQLKLRRRLIDQAVANGRVTHDVAWEDETAEGDARQPKGFCATMPIAELTAWAAGPVTLHAGSLLGPAPVPAGGYTGAVTQPGLFQLSDLEVKRLEHAAKERGRDPKLALRRLEEVRTMQIKGARSREAKRALGARFIRDRNHPDARTSRLVLGDETGYFTPDDLERFRTWASQAPIADFASVSQAAMAEFDLRYNIYVATPPVSWVEVIGDIRASGSIGDVNFPIDFQLVQYEKVTAQRKGADTPTLWYVDVRKEEYYVSAEADIRLLNEPNSFDYLNDSWLRQAQEMADARDDLKAQLAVAILTDNPLIYVNREKGPLNPGVNFFDAAHPVHPFKPEITDINGNATWSNYTSSATQFDATNLTAQKTKFSLVPNRRGRFMAMPATHVVAPTSLSETVNNTLRVQDLILAGALTQDSGAGVGTMGTVRSPHTGSGLLSLEVPHMPGVDATADWMLFSTERKARGMVPFVVAESAAEEVITWNEGSSYTNDTRFIKQERRTFCKVVPMHPEAVLYVVGS